MKNTKFPPGVSGNEEGRPTNDEIDLLPGRAPTDNSLKTKYKKYGFFGLEGITLYAIEFQKRIKQICQDLEKAFIDLDVARSEVSLYETSLELENEKLTNKQLQTLKNEDPTLKKLRAEVSYLISKIELLKKEELDYWERFFKASAKLSDSSEKILINNDKIRASLAKSTGASNPVSGDDEEEDEPVVSKTARKNKG